MRAALLLLALSAPAAATAEPPRPGDNSGWWLLPGFAIGGSVFGAPSPATVLGVELSVARLARGYLWWGAYADTGFIQGKEGGARGRLSTGLEAGYKFFGIDAGPTLMPSATHVLGARVRGFFTTGLGAVYLGAAFARAAPASLEFGLMVKVPIPLGRRRALSN